MSVRSTAKPEWKSTASILCECNFGIEVQLGGEGGRHFTRIRSAQCEADSLCGFGL